MHELNLPHVTQLDAPLPIRHAEIHDAARWQSLAAELAAADARLVSLWGRCDDEGKAASGGARISAAYALADGLLWLDLALAHVCERWVKVLANGFRRMCRIVVA